MPMAPVAMVALPGTLCPPAVFGRLARALAGEVTLDPVSWLTGPGPWDIPSVATRVGARIEERWGGPVLVCGHSTGGAIALRLAIDHTKLVRGLVLVDSGAHMHGHGDVDTILRRIRDDWGEELRAAVLDRSFRAPLEADVRSEYLAWAGKLRPEAVYDVLASQRDLDLTGQLGDIKQPAVVVHGRHDRARPYSQGMELARSLPDAEFRLAESGHTPVYETPGTVADAVRALITRAGGVSVTVR
jgi:3-oxoadipate enol-lactonase